MKALIFDLETRKGPDEVGGWGKTDQMGVSVLGAWRSDTAMYRVWTGDDLDEFIEWGNWADTIVGYNHLTFDYGVLSPLLNVSVLKQKKNIDLINVIRSAVGRRKSLDDVAWGTLGIRKTAGMESKEMPQLYREKQWGKLFKFVLDDTQITVKLFFHILQEHQITVDGQVYQINDSLGSVVMTNPDELQLKLF